MTGQGGNDRLEGLDGDDVLIGGEGADQLIGGGGIDTAIFHSYANVVTVSLINSSSQTGEATGDSYEGIEIFSVFGVASTFVGNSLDNTFIGSAGADNIDGGGGSDVLSGSDGEDRFVGRAGLLRIDGGNHRDTVDYSSSAGVRVALNGELVSSGAAIDNTLISIENLIGSNIGNDILIGNDDENMLSGGGGDDALFAVASSDHLNGGDGRDRADFFFISEAVYATITAYSVGTSGNNLSSSLTNIEDLGGSEFGDDQLFGDNLDNRLLGYGGSDRLEASGGNDELEGGGGNDFPVRVHRIRFSRRRRRT